MISESSSLSPEPVAIQPGVGKNVSSLKADDRNPAIDGLRGLALLSVILFHIHMFAIPLGTSFWEQAYSYVTGFGWAGVDLFFVLSGFLITGILIKSQASQHYYRTFYARRTIRIFPLYYVSLFLYFIVAPVLLRVLHLHRAADALIMPSTPALMPATQLFAWAYILNWRMWLAPHAVPAPIQHFWTLAIEEQFYIVWPLVVRRFVKSGLPAVCLVMIVGSLLLRIAMVVLDIPGNIFVTFCRLDALSLGAFLAYSLDRQYKWSVVSKAAPIVTAASIAGLLAIIFITGQSSEDSPLMSTLGITLCATLFGGMLVMVLEAGAGSFISRVTNFAGLRFLGIYSYCLYICHQPFILSTAHKFNSDTVMVYLKNKVLAVIAINCLDLLGPVVIALISWNLLEKHFLKLKSRPFFSYSSRSSAR